MAADPLNAAWKIATSFHDRRNAEPSEVTYYRSTLFRNEIDHGVYEYFSSLYYRIWDDDPAEPRGLRERDLYAFSAYLHVMGYPFLAAVLVRTWFLVMKIRQGKYTTP